MEKERVFISFDYDNDIKIKNALVGQSDLEDSPFEISDWSIKEHLTGDWKEKARKKMRNVSQVIILCGEHNAQGVNIELSLAQDENIPYFLLAGYKDKDCHWPSSAKKDDKMYNWTWDNLKLLIAGHR